MTMPVLQQTTKNNNIFLKDVYLQEHSLGTKTDMNIKTYSRNEI